MREQLSYVVTGVVGLVLALAVSALQPSSAAKLTTILRAVLLPEEAQDYEDLARRRGRPDEEHYWHDYRTGLEEQRRDRESGKRKRAAMKKCHDATMTWPKSGTGGTIVPALGTVGSMRLGHMNPGGHIEVTCVTE